MFGSDEDSQGKFQGPRNGSESPFSRNTDFPRYFAYCFYSSHISLHALDDHTIGLSHVNGLRSNGPWGFSLGTSRYPADPGIVYENAVTLLPIVKIWITDPLIQMPAGQYGFRFRCGCVLSAGV